MPQAPLSSNVAVNTSNFSAPMHLNAQNALITSDGGTSRTYNITAATVVKAAPGRLVRVSVIVAGSATGTVNDVATTGGVGAANQVGTIPDALGTTIFDWPCAVGITVVPGTGQTVAVSYT